MALLINHVWWIRCEVAICRYVFRNIDRCGSRCSSCLKIFKDGTPRSGYRKIMQNTQSLVKGAEPYRPYLLQWGTLHWHGQKWWFCFHFCTSKWRLQRQCLMMMDIQRTKINQKLSSSTTDIRTCHLSSQFYPGNPMLLFTNAFRVEVYLQPGVDAPWCPVSNSGNHRSSDLHNTLCKHVRCPICIQDVGIQWYLRIQLVCTCVMC